MQCTQPPANSSLVREAGFALDLASHKGWGNMTASIQNAQRRVACTRKWSADSNHLQTPYPALS